jgi:hypothetical protein
VVVIEVVVTVLKELVMAAGDRENLELRRVRCSSVQKGNKIFNAHATGAGVAGKFGRATTHGIQSHEGHVGVHHCSESAVHIARRVHTVIARLERQASPPCPLLKGINIPSQLAGHDSYERIYPAAKWVASSVAVHLQPTAVYTTSSSAAAPSDRA